MFLSAFLNAELLYYPFYEETPLKYENFEHFLLLLRTLLIHAQS